MKTKIMFLLLAGCLLALAAWFVRVPNPAQADEVPEKYRETVHKGLEYLVKSQFKDGHWEGDGGQHPVAMTGLAGLALLMERSPPSGRGLGGAASGKAKYAAEIHKAADWLMDKSQAKRDGVDDHAGVHQKLRLERVRRCAGQIADSCGNVREAHVSLHGIMPEGHT